MVGMLRLGFFLLFVPAVARGGLHYSGETPAELPAQWRGFLLDHRGVRLIGLPPAPGTPLHQLREEYQDAAAKLESVAKTRPLTADEAADLGALYVRLGKPGKAVEVLRPAARANPEHFRCAANLGTAWQVQGELADAIRALEEAVRLAPPRWKRTRGDPLSARPRATGRRKNATALDDLFGSRSSRRTVKAPRRRRGRSATRLVAAGRRPPVVVARRAGERFMATSGRRPPPGRGRLPSSRSPPLRPAERRKA